MLVVVWRITGRCPLRCPFCAYGIDAPRLHGDANEARVRRFSKVLADYQLHTGQDVLVSWLGGEPLLWPVLPELSRHLVHDLQLKVSATTNGMTLGAASVREHLAECYAELTLSIDGFAPFHDRMRGWPGAFEQLREGVRSLAAMSSRPKLRANTVLMRDNISDYPALCHELAEWGMDELTFNQLGGNDRPEFYPAHRLRMDDVDWLAQRLPALSAALQERGVHLNGSAGYLERIRASTAGRRLSVEDCEPGTRFLFVDEMGHAAPCSFTTSGYGVPVDELRTPADLLQLPLRFAERRSAKVHAACLDCHSTQVFHKFAA